MAVPSSGILYLGGLAFEKLEDEYDDGLPGTIDDSYGPFSLRDITQGGDTYGGGEDYDATNTASTSHPNNTAPYSMSEFYSYDHDTVALSIGSQKPQVFAYYITPSPNNGQTLTSQSALGTVAMIPNSTQSFSGTSTKRGSYTSTSSSINSNDLATTVNAASTNSWSIPTSGSLYNGLKFGVTYYTTMWAHNSSQNLTVLSGTTQWKFTMSILHATPTASVSGQTITMNANITDNGLGSNPATGATSNIIAKGFVYSTTNAAPLVGQSGTSGSSINPNVSGFGDEGAYSISVSNLSAGTYNIRAYARKTDINSGPVTAFTSYYYSSTIQVTVAAARTMYSTTLVYAKPNFACNQSEDNSAKWYSTSPPAVNTVVYTSQTGSGVIASGHYGYADGQVSSNRKITVGANGVITAHSNC